MLFRSIIDDMTETGSDKNRETRGQGIANTITGFLGGMAGCAMIGQSVINVKSGGRGRLSTFIAGAFLMFLIIVLGGVVVQIPMPVLVGIMIMVSIGTFDWSSFTYLVKAPRTDAIVMLVTVIIVVMTGDLSKGVLAGVLLSAVFFVAKISHIKMNETVEHDMTYLTVEGQLFFASVEDFVKIENRDIKTKQVIIDFAHSHIWDDSGVAAVQRVKTNLEEKGYDITIKNLNQPSEDLIRQLE